MKDRALRAKKQQKIIYKIMYTGGQRESRRGRGMYKVGRVG